MMFDVPAHSQTRHGSILACRDVWLAYKNREVPVLRGISLSIREGSLVGVIGPNGSGKSTLLRVLGGRLAASRGTVTLDEKMLHRLGKQAIAREIAVLVQEEAMDFAFTVKDVVAMGRAPHHGGLYFEDTGDIRAIEKAMERAEVAHLADRPIDTLSGGERQKVRIARALAQEPRFLLLDEPTNHLDLHSRLTVMELLRQIHSEGLAILIVSHEINLVAELCESVRLIHDGSFMCEGPPAEVITEQSIASCFDIKALVDVNPVTGTPRVTPLSRLHSR